MNKFWKWLDEDFEESVLMVLLILMSVVMMAQVIMRYVFNQSMPWPEEFCRYTFVVSGAFSIGYCIRKDRMLKVDILMGLFPKAVVTILDLVGRVMTLVFFGYLAKGGFAAMNFSRQGGMVSPAMGIPMWYLYACMFFGCCIGVIRQIEDLIKWARKNKKEGEQ